MEFTQYLNEEERISDYLSNVLESLTSGVLAIDLEGRITLFNRAAEEITGFQYKDVAGRLYMELIGRETEEKLTLPFVLKQQKPNSIGWKSGVMGRKEILSKTGKKIPVNYSTSILQNKEGKMVGALEEFSELAGSAWMEEETMRVRALATLGEMAAVVAHEVKNPLGGIRGFADLLDRDLPEGDPRKRLVKKITEGVETLDRIVLSLLEGTKPIQIIPRRVEIKRIVDEAINFFEMDPARTKSNIHIKRIYTPKDLNCLLDVEQFRQVLLNLLHNAVQAMPEGGEITVELKSESAMTTQEVENDRAILRISDTGEGMSPTTKERLFVPFYTTKARGTGLGLATVKRIVEAHRGDIQVESDLGKGTAVQIRLPRAE